MGRPNIPLLNRIIINRVLLRLNSPNYKQDTTKPVYKECPLEIEKWSLQGFGLYIELTIKGN